MATACICCAEWGNGGRLWGAVQPAGFFDGAVNGFAVIPVLLGRAFAANVTAVLVVVRLGYAATLQELLRPEPAALARPDGLRDGEHHVADAQVLFRSHGDRPRGGFEVHEVHEVAARKVTELAVVAHPVDEQAQGEVDGVRPRGCLLQQGGPVHGSPSFMRRMSEMMLPAIPCRRSTSTSRNMGLKQYTQKVRSRSCRHSLYNRFTRAWASSYLAFAASHSASRDLYSPESCGSRSSRLLIAE
ncbi:hypothetical protein M123_4783 [Bacteroides fragilis str. 3976T8]|uniref:Uncharacterized protein n=1 Tax=Bacteroides fragilis str. 3976T8 TaxID=1339314 RepID=A0A016C450_BACFG|nr:hypothetical protein M123_4783 [Bacteroides fragilis str. 3976T8]